MLTDLVLKSPHSLSDLVDLDFVQHRVKAGKRTIKNCMVVAHFHTGCMYKKRLFL